MDEPTWDDWLAALDEVASATGVQYAMAIDNKGHRFAGPAMSLGANFFDDEGNFDLEDDEGFRAFAMILKDLIDAGKSPAETWLGTSQYTGAQDYFINVETVMYFSGSWQIGALCRRYRRRLRLGCRAQSLWTGRQHRCRWRRCYRRLCPD